MNSIGGRKFALGIVYLLGSFVMIGMAISTRDAAVVASVAAACVALAPGIAAIIWGNVATHRAQAEAEKS